MSSLWGKGRIYCQLNFYLAIRSIYEELFVEKKVAWHS